MSKKLLMIVTILVVAAFAIMVTIFVRGNNEYESILTQFNEGIADENELIEHMNELGYSVYPNSTDGDKYAFIKNKGEEVSFEYSKNSFDYTFLYMRDYSVEKELNFIMFRTFEDTRYIYSIGTEGNTILIEQEVYNDCSKTKCTTDRDVELTIDQYVYNLETGKFIDENEIESYDFTDDLAVYFAEMKLFNEKEGE